MHCKQTRLFKVCSLCAKRKKKRKLAQSAKNTCPIVYVSHYREGGVLGISLECALLGLLNHGNPEGDSVCDCGQ